MTSSKTPKAKAIHSSGSVVDAAGIQLRERDLYAARFIDKVVREIRRVVDQKKRDGMTLTELAHCMNVDKGQLSRQLSGSRNMTLRTIGEISWALNCKPTFSLNYRPADQNHFTTQASTSTIARDLTYMRTPTEAPQTLAVRERSIMHTNIRRNGVELRSNMQSEPAIESA